MTIPLNQIICMPAYSPYLPYATSTIPSCQVSFVFFHADTLAIDRILPECFTQMDQGICVAIGISIPWSANYRAFEEIVVTVPCAFEGQAGYFTPVVFLN